MRLGIIGPGLIWEKKHKQALAKLSSVFTVTAFCASSERRKAETLQDFPQAVYETDLQKFVKRADIDAVVVLTPIHLNAPAAIAAMRAGKDVFLEKPLAHSLEAGRGLIKTAGQTGRRVWVLENAVYEPGWQELKKLFHDEMFGEPVHFDQVIHFQMDSDVHDRGGYGKTAWRIQPEYPLGLFFDGGIHQVAVLSSLFGPPEWVFATGAKLHPEFGDYDHIVIQFGYQGKLAGVLSHSSALGDACNSFTIWGMDGVVSIQDDRFILNGNNGGHRQIELPASNPHDEMWAAFARAIDHRDETLEYPLERAWGDLRLMFAVEQSIKTGQKVSLSTIR
jgi:scyllo-inositol 2-dehydrogenase (NADP+)